MLGFGVFKPCSQSRFSGIRLRNKNCCKKRENPCKSRADSTWGIQLNLFSTVLKSLRNGSPPKKALKKTIFGLAKIMKTLENQGLLEIKQNPENFFSGSFLLVDHQGLEPWTPCGLIKPFLKFPYRLLSFQNLIFQGLAISISFDIFFYLSLFQSDNPKL